MEIPKGGILWDMLSDLVKRRIERGEGGGSTVSVSQSDSQMQQIAASVHAVATANYTASGTGTTIDGITPVAGRLYLLAAQTDAKLNGIYECSDGFWVRHTLTVGMIVTVRAGTLFAGTVWTMTAPTSSLTIGTDAITFMLHSSRTTGADGALQLRDNTTGKLKSLAEFFINSTTKVLSGFRAIFSSDFGDTITATTTHNSTSSSAIVANAANATGVKVIAKVPLDITGTGISTMTASGALQYTFDMSIDSTQVDSHVVRMLNITSDTRRAHGLYLSGNGHADSRGLTCVGAQITKLLWVNGRLQLNSRYEESASASLHDYNTSDRSSIEFKGIVGAQTLTGIVAGADGQVLVIHGKCAFTIAHNSTSSTAGNRIDTMRGNNLTSDSNGFSAILRYNSRRSMWEVVTWHRGALGVTQSQVAVSTNTAAATYDAATRNYINSNAVQLNNARADIAAIITALQQHRIL